MNICISCIAQKVIIITGSFLVGFLVYWLFTDIKNKTSLHKSKKIYEILEKYQISYDIDKASIDSKTELKTDPIKGIDQAVKNIDYFICQQKPIHMLLVGFPFKSANTDKKVISNKADMAERKSLEYLQQILNEIKKIYSPGAHILIFTDGIAFAEFFGISINEVFNYESDLKKLAFDLPDISFITSEEMLKKYNFSSVNQIIDLFDQYHPTNQEFKATLKEIPTTALQRFALELDYPRGQEILKKHSLEDIAINLLARENRMRAYLAEAFKSPEFFRLTVHYSADVSKKFGIKLSPNSEVTSYHGVLVLEKDGSWYIKFKKDIDIKKYKIQYQIINNTNCAYYRPNLMD